MMSSKDRAARRGVDAEVTDFNAAIKAQEELAAQDRRRNDPVSPLDGVSADDWQYWLDYVGSGLTERERELMDAFARFDKGFPVIADDDVQGRATDLANKMKAHLKKIDDTRTLEKAPVLAAQRAIDGFFKAMSARLENALPVINRRRTVYAEQVVARRQAEMDTADLAEATTADLSRVHSQMGGVASLRTAWKLDVEKSDIMTLLKAIVAGNAPISFVKLDEVRIGSAIRSHKLRECPGLVISEQREVK
jgi:hypothetical protein